VDGGKMRVLMTFDQLLHSEVGLCMCGYATMQINKLGQKGIATFFMGMTVTDEEAELSNKPTTLKSGHPTCTVTH
jgi:hypothetical protein